MADLSEFSYGCNNPYCNCRYDGRGDWPVNNREETVEEPPVDFVAGESEGKLEAQSTINNDLNRKEGVLQRLEEMAANKELSPSNRKDDSLVTRLEEVAAGRRQHYDHLPQVMLEGVGGVAEKNDSAGDLLDSENSSDGHDVRYSIAEYEDDVFFLEAFEKEEIEKTCVVALATLINARLTTGGNSKEDMRGFLQQVFNFSEEKLQVLTRKAEEEQESPELTLTVKVISGTSLSPKDANGKSDPYCRLGMLPKKEMSRTVSKEDLHDWEKAGLVKEIVATSIKPATLEPQWNEEFELMVVDPSNEMLVLEVWDSDADEVQQSSHIKGIKGFGHFLSDLRKKDDFMGRCFYSVDSIPASGETKTFGIHSHSGKSKYGYISTHMAVRGSKKNTSIQVSVWEHTMLLRALVNFSSRRGNAYVRRWDGKLSPNAEHLLEQHALMNGLNVLQLVAIRLSVFLKYHKLHAMSMSTMFSLLEQLKDCKAFLPKNVSPKRLAEGKGGQDLEWLAQLFSDLNELGTNMEDLFRKHLSLFSISKCEDIQRIKDSLKTLKELYSFRPFVHQLPPNEKADLKELLTSCITEAIPSWFSILNAKLLPLVPTDLSNLEAVRNLAKESLNFCHKVLKTLDPLFMELGMSYFTLFYVSLDGLLAKEVESRIAQFEASPDIAALTFETYTSCRELAKLSQYVSPDKTKELSLTSSHTWFKAHVKSWISLVITRCKALIQKSIDFNETVTDKIKISTSAVDTTGFLVQVAEFWRRLDWPEATVAYSMMVYMLQEVSDLAHFYVQQVYQARMEKYKSLSTFAASDDLCIDLNNMQHVRTQINELPVRLKFDQFYKWLEEKSGAGLSENAKDIVGRVLSNADDDFEHHINLVVTDLSKRMAPEIWKRIDKTLSAPETTPDLDAVAPLMDYLNDNLQTLVGTTYPEIFSCILYPIWTECVKVVKKSLAELSDKKSSSVSLAYQRLHTLLSTLTDFFHLGGQGLDLADMQVQEYLEVKAELDFLKLNSEELTLQFFLDLVAMQEEVDRQGEKELGDLKLSVRYNAAKEAVDVHVIQANKLPVMDRTGSSDPYVVLSLLPQWKFPEVHKKVFKTPVVKTSLDPYFDKDFMIPAKPEDVAVQGSILLLTLYDYDLITADDFMGMCVVPLHTLPGVGPVATGRSSRQNLVLSLFQLSDSTKSRAASELTDRANKGDPRAVNFFKVNCKILGGNIEKLFKV